MIDKAAQNQEMNDQFGKQGFDKDGYNREMNH